MRLVVVPIGIGGLGDVDVCGFSQSVLAGVCATYFYVEGIATVTGTDDDGLTCKGAQGFEDGLAELLQGRDVLRRYTVVDVVGNCCSASFKFGYCKMWSQS